MATDNTGNLVWLIDEEFDSYDLERDMLKGKGYELVTSREGQYASDYEKYAKHARGLIVWVGHPVTAEDIKGLPSCRVISARGGGYDNIDVEAATGHGIAVTCVPGYCVEEVSDHTLAFILFFNRRLHEGRDMTRAGRWRADKISPTRRLNTQILGLIGFGKIARGVARKAKCLGLQVWTCDPYVNEDELKLMDIRRAEFKELLRQSDFISLHVPLTRDTRYLIDARAFELMKPTACLINTCRGEVVDETALIDALEHKRIAGAGLDVLATEPPDPRNPLPGMPNVLVSPHSAYISQEALTEVLTRSTRAAIDAIEGRVPEDLINPAVYGPSRGDAIHVRK
jgi:D-3-phosphoglycerate dehydrogenase